jgi:predicted O-methyltransferase YrrM
LSRPSLGSLAARFGTDKGTAAVPSGLSPKGYTEHYEHLFGPLEVSRLLELGVAKGASVRMWAAWLPDAIIIGVDKGPLPNVAELNVRLYRGRQADQDLLERLAAAYGPFDVVIDDGSHKAWDQLVSLEALWPHVRPGGFYAIEDLHAPGSCVARDVEFLATGADWMLSSASLLVVRKPASA